MELVKTYEEYNELNKEYVKYIQMVMESDISNYDDIIMNNLENYSNLFEDLKLRSDKIEEEEKYTEENTLLYDICFYGITL